jgi:hypothetical protein
MSGAIGRAAEGRAAALSVFCPILKEDIEGLRAAISRSTFDPDAFLSFAKAHNVAGYVHAVLAEEGHLALLPSRLQSGLADAGSRQIEKCDRLIGEIQRLKRRLERAGLDVTFLKGPFLSKRFYGNPRHRHYGDIDLLVRGRKDLIATDRVLRTSGYDRLSIPLLGYGAAMRFAYHFSYRSERGKVDLHWALRSHFSWDIDYGRLWSERETERLADREFPVLSPEHDMLLLVVSILGDYQKARLRMKFLVDLYKVLQFMGDDTDWAAFCGRRQREGVLRITGAVLGLALELLDAREEFPNLTRALALTGDRGRPNALGDPLECIEFSDRASDKIRNHLRSYRLHETGLVRAVGWRILAEPFHRTVLRN